MKIAATGDIHYDLMQKQTEMETFFHFIKSMEVEKPDVLVLAGDTVGLDASRLEECLNAFSSVSPNRLLVFGNHEHWSTSEDTFSHLETLKPRIKGCGFKLLDEAPEIISGIGFAGNAFWYDYSFAPEEPPPSASYEQKTFKGHTVWNDVRYAKIGQSDIDYTNALLNKLETDIRELESEVQQIVVVTHHVGFAEMLTVREGFPVRNFCNAFMGSHRLGGMLLRHPKVRYHICGHTHVRSVVTKASLISINPGSTYDEKLFIALEIPDDIPGLSPGKSVGMISSAND